MHIWILSGNSIIVPTPDIEAGMGVFCRHNFLFKAFDDGNLSNILLRYPHMDNKESINTQKKLGNRLKAARKKAGLTQAQVATQAGVNLNFYARLERGEVNVSFERLENILKALGVKALPID